MPGRRRSTGMANRRGVQPRHSRRLVCQPPGKRDGNRAVAFPDTQIHADLGALSWLSRKRVSAGGYK
jgi:hypothetical protein